jgi:tRNA pseudouridine38-40 synthase
MLIGENDFQAFTLSDQLYASYRRTILRAEWIRRERLIEFWIEGNAFTRRMVRGLVSYQLDVARGARSLDEFARLLQGAPRAEGGATAAACGLYLATVGFPDPPVT